MKRASPSSKQGASQSKKTTITSPQQTTQLRPFIFEDLPDAVRNQIYELVAIREITYLPTKTPRLSSTSRLLMTNHQISHEFATMLDGSDKIHITITDFNFTNLVKFINTRSDVSLKHISKATLSIKLDFGQPLWVRKGETAPDSHAKLVRWLKCIERVECKGKTLVTKYRATIGSSVWTEDWGEAVDNCIVSRDNSGKAEEELEKITVAIDGVMDDGTGGEDHGFETEESNDDEDLTEYEDED